MAKKLTKNKRKQQKAKQTDTSSMNPRQLEALGNSNLEAGNFSKAIEMFRILFVKEGPELWLAPLQKAYLGKTSQLAAKGLIKEAQVFFDNCQRITGTEFPPISQITILFNLTQFSKAVAHYFTKIDSLKEHGNLCQQFEQTTAALLIAGKIVPETIPAEHHLRIHLPLCLRALNALATNDREACHEELKNIPFRSPYRDFKLAMKGLVALSSKEEDPETFFAKISSASPFATLARTGRLLHCPPQEISEKLGTLSREEQEFVINVKGITKRTLRILSKQINGQLLPKRIFSEMTGTKDKECILPPLDCALKLLIYSPNDIKQYNHFYPPLKEKDGFRLMALSAEQHKYFHDATDLWFKHLLLLQKEPEVGQRNLEIALIYRRMFNIAEKHLWDGRRHNKMNQEEYSWLEKSLKYDPCDKSTWQTLIKMTPPGDKKARQRHIESALGHFPDDIDFLLLAADAATRKGTFKKAVHFIEKILAVDPINVKARALLLDLHLEHAQKQTQKGRIDLAYKELDSALHYCRKGSETARIVSIRGLTQILAGDVQNGRERIEESFSLFESPLMAATWVLFQAQIYNKTSKALIAEFGKNLKGLLQSMQPKEHLLDLIRFLMTKIDDNFRIVSNVIGLSAQGWAKRSGDNFSRDEVQVFCEFFMELDENTLAEKYASQGLTRHKDDPLLTCFLIMSQHSSPNELTSKHHHQLEQALRRARDQGDHRAVHRILEYFDPFYMDPPDDFFSAEDEEMFNEIFGNLPNEQHQEILMQAMEELFKKKIPKSSQKGKIEQPKIDPSRSFFDQDQEVISSHRGNQTQPGPKKNKVDEEDANPQLKLF